MTNPFKKEWTHEVKKFDYSYTFKLIDIFPYLGLVTFTIRNYKKGLMAIDSHPSWLLMVHFIWLVMGTVALLITSQNSV